MSLTTSAFAAETSIIPVSNHTKGHDFKSKWMEPVKKVQGGTHTLNYGYNTFLINEDVAYADSNGYIHRAKIVNANGTHYGPKRAANAGTSDQEVRHKGSTVKYYCNVFK